MKIIRFLIGILISLVFLYLAFRRVDLREVSDILLKARLDYFVLAIVFTIIALFVRSFRWQVMLSPHQKIKVTSLFQATCFGQMFNNLLPFRLGDLAQAYFLGFREKMSKSMVFSTVILERLMDLVTPTLVVIISSFIFILPGKEFGGKRFLVFVAIILTIFFILLIFRKRIQNIIINLLPSDSKLRKEIERILNSFYSGFYILKHPYKLVGIIGYTFVLWTFYFLTSYVSMLSVGIELSFWPVILATVITTISVAIPSSPGYIGSWEFFAVLGLSLFQINKPQALSYALLYHFTQYATVTLLGLFVLFKTGISISDIGRNLFNENNSRDAGI